MLKGTHTNVIRSLRVDYVSTEASGALIIELLPAVDGRLIKLTAREAKRERAEERDASDSLQERRALSRGEGGG
jgi:hypothetical protein